MNIETATITNKSKKQTHSIDYLNLLEYKLQQDRIAYKKVLKWATTIQTRIEKTRLKTQLDNFKNHIPITTKHQ